MKKFYFINTPVNTKTSAEKIMVRLQGRVSGFLTSIDGACARTNCDSKCAKSQPVVYGLDPFFSFKNLMLDVTSRQGDHPWNGILKHQRYREQLASSFWCGAGPAQLCPWSAIKAAALSSFFEDLHTSKLGHLLIELQLAKPVGLPFSVSPDFFKR